MANKVQRRKEESYGVQQLQGKLSLARWQMQLATETGLLKRAADGRIENSVAEAIFADLPGFLKRLSAEELVNSRDAAAHLDITRPQFKRMQEAELVTPREYGEFRYGQFPLYRRGDLDEAKIFAADQVEVHEEQKLQNRKGAGIKAQQTRKLNQQRIHEQTQQARKLLRETLGISDPVESSMAQLAFWLELVGSHADTLRRRSGRARKPDRKKEFYEQAQAIYAHKDAALRTLVSLSNPYVKLGFVNAAQLRLCWDCKETCRELGYRFNDWGGCEHCSTNHFYSLVAVDVKTSAGYYEFFIPYPTVAAWSGTKTHDDTHSKSGLIKWVHKLPSMHRDGGLGAYDSSLPESLLKAFNAQRSIEGLQAALQSLTESHGASSPVDWAESLAALQAPDSPDRKHQ